MPRILLDPCGVDDRLNVVVEGPTGVEYATQCGGLACEERSVEGYLIPVDLPLLDGPNPCILDLRGPFHDGTTCLATDRAYTPLGEPRLNILRGLISQIRLWHDDKASSIVLDESRSTELTEGWIPVLTPFGRGVLIAPNCD